MKKSMLVVCVIGAALLRPASARADYTYWASTDNFTTNFTQWFAADAKHRSSYDHNWAYLPTTLDTSRGGPTLLLFFAGSGANLDGASEWDGYTRFMEEAMHRGYVVIGLAYRNDYSHTSLCGCMAACMDELENQNVTGIDKGFYAADRVTAKTPYFNSVNYRLQMFLGWLQGNHYGNNFNWTQFLSYDEYNRYLGPAWSKIVVAGHSGGGNMATWILKNEHPIGALTFSSPNPSLDVDKPAHDPIAGYPTIQKWTPYGASSHSCTKQPLASLPDWVTAGFGAHLMVYDDLRDQAYNGLWPGHDIPHNVKHIGLSELQYSDHSSTDPSGPWITRKTDSTKCFSRDNVSHDTAYLKSHGCDISDYSSDCDPFHSEPIGNCAGTDSGGRPTHHRVWDYLLDSALKF